MHLDKKHMQSLSLPERKDYLYNLRDTLLIKCERIEERREELSKFGGYKSDTKVRINEIADELLEITNGKGCWIAHSIKTSRKRDLIGTLDNIGHRVTQNYFETLDLIKTEMDKLHKDLEVHEQREAGRALMQRVYNETDWKQHRSEMDYEKAGNWDCFVDLVEEGKHITIDNISDYGVDLQP